MNHEEPVNLKQFKLVFVFHHSFFLIKWLGGYVLLTLSSGFSPSIEDILHRTKYLIFFLIRDYNFISIINLKNTQNNWKKEKNMSLIKAKDKTPVAEKRGGPNSVLPC